MNYADNTEERLRNRLDSNQAARERLCVHLLPLLGDYRYVTPRRPKGGPDGARDMEAISGSGEQVWGAVGFQNGANDSNEQKKWVRKKFKDDLLGALKQNQDLKHFVFFTNVDLTPGELSKLQDYAAKKDVFECHIFYRELLRKALDSPEGLGYRLQFLGIEMSYEEQVSFINRLEEKRTEELKWLNEQQEQINAQVHRLEFLNECLRPVYEAAILVRLIKNYTSEELGHFRVASKITQIRGKAPWSSLFLGGRDSYMSRNKGDTNIKIFGSKTVSWKTNPKAQIHDLSLVSPRIINRNYLWFRTPLYEGSPFPLVGDFDRASFDIYVTEPLLKQLHSVAILVNGFVIVEIPKELILIADDTRLKEHDYLEPIGSLSEDESKIPWKALHIKSRKPREIHFSKITPCRLSIEEEYVSPLYDTATLLIR